MQQLQIKIFKDGTQKLQYLAYSCGTNHVWANVPIVVEESSKDDCLDDVALRREF
jgi:hypothetical protein